MIISPSSQSAILIMSFYMNYHIQIIAGPPSPAICLNHISLSSFTAASIRPFISSKPTCTSRFSYTF